LDVARIRRALASRAGEGASAVPPERIFDALHGRLRPEERRSVVNALVSDPEAAEAWRLARELMPAAAAASLRSAAWTWMSMAAAIALVASGAWLVVDLRAPLDAPVYRAGEQRAITSLVPAGTALSRTQPVLRWTPLERARYRLRILTPELALLVETGELTHTEYTLPAEILRQIPPGGSMLWQVDARIPGEAGIVSPTFTVRVD
jgi:hypothetical protein